MATSTEQINELIAGNTALKAFFETERAALQAARASLPAEMNKVYYVKEATGLPGADGTLADPLDSIDTALSKVKAGQHVQINVDGFATWRRQHYFNSVNLTIAGYSSAGRVPLTFAPVAQNNAKWQPGIASTGNTSISFRNLDITLPVSTAQNPTSSYFSGVGALWLAMLNCGLTGTGANGAWIGDYSAVIGVNLDSCTITDMAGRWVQGKAAGTAITNENSNVLNAHLLPNV